MRKFTQRIGLIERVEPGNTTHGRRDSETDYLYLLYIERLALRFGQCEDHDRSRDRKDGNSRKTHCKTVLIHKETDERRSHGRYSPADVITEPLCGPPRPRRKYFREYGPEAGIKPGAEKPYKRTEDQHLFQGGRMAE